MISLLVAAAVAAAAAPPPPTQPLDEAAHAIASGRLDQARIMIGNAIKAGAQSGRVERLLADLAFESGDCRQALARYEALLAANPADPQPAERAGICAARIGEIARAATLLERATALPAASWRAWSARGVTADHRGDWQAADRFYARAAELAPDRADVTNNQGWSRMLRGDWAEALVLLERAAALDPASRRIADNLELARAALAEELPRRRDGEGDSDWAARLNDAGVVARLRGENRRAVAAFAQAIEARSLWFERAANNLALVEGRE
jgi:Flp pilus assembly protein TadD